MSSIWEMIPPIPAWTIVLVVFLNWLVMSILIKRCYIVVLQKRHMIAILSPMILLAIGYGQSDLLNLVGLHTINVDISITRFILRAGTLWLLATLLIVIYTARRKI